MWKVIKHTESTDGKSEKWHLELFLKFDTHCWNSNVERPVIKLYYHDYKVESGYWLDREQTNWYTRHPHKSCKIQFQYFQSHPEVTLYSIRERGYDGFDLDYCKDKAMEIFTDRLTSVLNQCNEIKENFIKQNHVKKLEL
jgi:hypothetical protein